MVDVVYPGGLAEVSFGDVIQRKFPFEIVFAFDICEASDIMVVSVGLCSVIVAKLSTAEETLRISSADFIKSRICKVCISPSGKLICLSDESGLDVLVYSSLTGELKKQITFQHCVFISQFISEEKVLACLSVGLLSAYGIMDK